MILKNEIIFLENTNYTAGTVYEESLIYGGVCGVLNEMVQINEASDLSSCKPIKFRGKFQEAEAINKNKRSYPKPILESNVKRLDSCIKEGGLCGELDHPTDSIIHFKEASHKITKLWWEGNTLMGEGVILNTPCGKILKSLINDGVRIGISSRGVGNGKVNESGVLVIGESYKLITFDAVADPSTHSAYQKQVVSKKIKENSEDYEQISHNNTEFNVKNEHNSINKINKELFIACFSGIVNKKTQDILKRG